MTDLVDVDSLEVEASDEPDTEFEITDDPTNSDEIELSAEAEEHEDLAAEVEQETSEDAKLAKVQEFIDSNYGGDEDKFVASLYESRKEMGKLSSNVNELTELVHSLVAEAPEPADQFEPEIDPRVEQYQEALQEFTEDYNSIQAMQSKLLSNISSIEKEINKTEGKITHADDDSAGRYESELANLRREQKSLATEWEKGNTTSSKLQRKYNSTAEKLAKVEARQVKDIESQKLAQRTARIKQAKEAGQYNNDVTVNIDGIIEKSDLVVNKQKAMRTVRSIAKDEHAAYCKEHGVQSVPNFGKWLKAITDDYIGDLQATGNKKFSTASKRKAQAAGVSSPARATAKAAKQTRAPVTQADFEALAVAAKQRIAREDGVSFYS